MASCQTADTQTRRHADNPPLDCNYSFPPASSTQAPGTNRSVPGHPPTHGLAKVVPSAAHRRPSSTLDAPSTPSNGAMPVAYTQRRARSLPSPSPSPSPSLSPLAASAQLPLTSERLALHTSLVESQAHPTSAAISISMSMAPPPSPSRTNASASSVSKTKPRDNENKLIVYGILVCTGKPLPAEIRTFVSALQAGTRSSLGAAHSPNTRNVAQQQMIALRQAKQDGIDMLRDFLLFPDHDGSMLAIRAQPHLHKCFLPSNAALAKAWGTLEAAQPDHMYGYLHARDNKGPTAFPRVQERSLFLDGVASVLHFPFLSAQWKSARGDQGHHHARLQGTSPRPRPSSNPCCLALPSCPCPLTTAPRCA
jgi:hypothetical protein